jgi:hypothetical protein
MSKRFPTDLADRGTVKVTDKLLIHNIDTGVTEYTTVQKLINSIGVAGLKFPAIQVPNADLNTLDDYEEGIWNPLGALVVPGTSVTSLNYGCYTKIGNVVICSFRFQFDKGTGTGIFTITGLPFVSRNAGGLYRSPLAIVGEGIFLANGQLQGRISTASNIIGLSFLRNTDGVIVTADNTHLAVTTYISGQLTYHID